MNTITVYVTEHDDESVRYVINDIDDMRDNYDDLIDEGYDPGTFEDYLSSWTAITMPVHVWESGNDALIHAFIIL